MQLAMLDLHLKRYNEVLEKSMSLKFAAEGVLFDKSMQTRSIMFMRYVTVWLLRVATTTDFTPENPPEYVSLRPHYFNRNMYRLPLSTDMPESFRHLPEYALEDVVSNFNFIMQ